MRNLKSHLREMERSLLESCVECLFPARKPHGDLDSGELESNCAVHYSASFCNIFLLFPNIFLFSFENLDKVGLHEFLCGFLVLC